MTEYRLPHDLAGEQQRLKLMSALLDPLERAHIDRLGVGPGWRCLELGNGNGSRPTVEPCPSRSSLAAHYAAFNACALIFGGFGPNIVQDGRSFMPAMLEGGCACGKARYRLASRPMFVHCCHCRDCQRQTGSAFVINALIETSRVEKLSGETRAVRVPTDSGQPHEIHRCPHCATAVWSHYGGRRELSFVRVGTLEDPSEFPPDVHIYTRSKLRWITLPAGVPAFPAYYDSKTLWPPESLERRKAMFG